MADVRVPIAGARERVGRTLIHAIAATKGLLWRAPSMRRAPPSRCQRVRGLGANGVKVTSDVAPPASCHS
jgi:hypothetical protein